MPSSLGASARLKLGHAYDHLARLESAMAKALDGRTYTLREAETVVTGGRARWSLSGAPWLETMLLREIQERHLLQIFALANAAGQAPLTIRNYHRLIAQILDYACHRDQKILGRNPARAAR